MVCRNKGKRQTILALSEGTVMNGIDRVGWCGEYERLIDSRAAAMVPITPRFHSLSGTSAESCESRFARLRMTPTTQRIEVTLETLLESVDLAESIVKRVAEASGFEEDDVHKIGMAVREGVINAYNYGNQHDRQKKIHITLELEPERMIVHVADEGKGFELTEVPDPLAEENLLRTSGRGLFLMRAFMDDLHVRQRPAGGAELIMSKRFPQGVSDNGRRR
jgi:serine/threonine-protein kinase RsbW